ncbi:MAG TPA: hypothetical protein VFS39_14465 [Nitrospira sp.]|nr:hypothetical protein [Nitrospira sp.]
MGSNPIARSISSFLVNGSPGGVILKTLSLLFFLAIPSLAGCHYYEEYRVMKTKADLQAEQAELMKAYRLCLSKYQDEPPKAKEICSPYTQTLREIEVRRQSSR